MDDTTERKPQTMLGREETDRLRATERAFLLRPKVSIRLRIVAGFLLCFFLLAMTGLVNLAILYQARGKLRFLDISQDLSLDIAAARHLMRLDFPDPGNLRAARGNAKKASDLLISEGVNILDVGGEKDLVSLSYKLGHYVRLIDDALALAQSPSPAPARVQAMSDTLESRGEEVMNLLRTMKSREAAAANHVLQLSQELPFIFAGVMLLIIFWITNLLANTITGALKRVEDCARRIIDGDYTPMNPARRYRDELSDLPLAVNRILLELRIREAQVNKADKLASVGAFATGISQQLNVLFTSMQSRADGILRGGQAPERCSNCGALKDIEAETRQGKGIVEGLLEFTRDEPDKLIPLRLTDLVEAARKMVQHEMTLSGVTLQVEIPEDMPPVQGAFGPLQQVFLNLLHNAVQAMPQGGTVVVRVGFLGGDQAKIIVADNGVGIPREDLGHLFDPSFTPEERANASGLGMSVSQRIVKRYGGDIHVESVVGKGTTVHITLPLEN